jgi:hypothetical protein
MKLLVFMTHAGYARNFEWALRLLAERGHEIDVILENPAKPDVADPLNALAARYRNVTVEATPKRANGEWCEVSARIRAYLDYLQYLHPSFGYADMPRNRAARRLPSRLVTALNLAPLRRPAAQLALRRLLAAGYRSVPVDAAVRRFIADRRPDAVLITPLVEIASKQADHLAAAQDLGIPVGVVVASWDNLHCKGTIHQVPELVTVWNEVQRREAVELHGIPEDRVAVTGAVAFDHWYDWKPSRSREAFCETTGLDPDRPFALYVGSSRNISPGEAEFALRCITGIRGAPQAGIQDLQVLIRPHPQNHMRGEDAREALEAVSDVVIYPPAGANPTDAQSRTDYFDSMYHCSVVLGVSTTAFLEATIVDRPVHSVLVGEYAATQSGTPQFRVMHPENRGMLELAESIDELAHQLAASVRDSGPASERNRTFRDHFLRPIGSDVPASPLLVDEIERLPSRPRVTPERASVPLRLAGRLLALAVRAYVRHERRQAELEEIGGKQWREQFATFAAEDRARKQAMATSTKTAAAGR